MSRYNKAWAAGLAQAVIQIVATFVPFEPELEQALGAVLTAAIVWAVPNTPPDGPSAPAPAAAARLLSPLWAGAGAAVLALSLGACAGVGDRVADRVLGPACGPESRAFRATLLTKRLLVRYPATPAGALLSALSGMQAAADTGGDMTAAAAAYRAALAGSFGPMLGGAGDEPVLIRLNRLPGPAEDFLLIRTRLRVFCTAAPAASA